MSAAVELLSNRKSFLFVYKTRKKKNRESWKRRNDDIGVMEMEEFYLLRVRWIALAPAPIIVVDKHFQMVFSLYQSDFLFVYLYSLHCPVRYHFPPWLTIRTHISWYRSTAALFIKGSSLVTVFFKNVESNVIQSHEAASPEMRIEFNRLANRSQQQTGQRSMWSNNRKWTLLIIIDFIFCF